MSKSGTNRHERERFLLDQNFQELRAAKGSHVIWEHAVLKELAKTNKIEAPINLRQNPAQPPWEVPVPCDPAVGTWRKISKFAKWADDTANQLLGLGVKPDPLVETKREFLKARNEICEWKRETKHRLTADLAPNPAPASYKDFMSLEAKLKSLSM
ncbi:MAG: hypothetical protein ACAH80_13275 [Alphaproteobacteria bacterium]